MERGAFLKRLIFGFVLINLLTALIVAFSLANSYEQINREAETEASSLVQIMERSLSGMLREVDIVLQTCAEEIEHQSANGRSAPPESIDAFLLRQHKHLPELNALRVVDATGRIINGIGPPLGKGISIADRDYFLRARDVPQSGLIFSKPLLARTDPVMSIFLARRLNHPDGSFAGIVYTAIPLERIQTLFQSLYIGPKGVIALFDLDKMLVTRHPTLRKDDTTEAPMRVPAEFLEAHRNNRDHGSFSLRSPLDGVERVVSYRKASRYPGYLFVGIAKDDDFAAWHRDRVTMAIRMALVATVTGTVACFMFGRWKQHEAQNQRLIEQSRTDALTQCANRRHLMEALASERQRSLRNAKCFCLLALDLDHFKAINDEFGHLGGDQALRHFAAIAKNALRAIDTLGRMGGEEFCVLLPETRIESAMKIAERIRAELESLPIMLNSTPVTMTVSIGIAAWRADGTDTSEKLLSRADKALYEAKRSGRNKVHAERPQDDG